MESDAAVVGGDDKLFTARHVKLHTDGGTVAEAHIGVNLLGFAVFADCGNQRENADPAAHDGNFFLLVGDIESVAERHQDGKFFTHAIVARQRPRAASLEPIAHRDALPFRLADGDGTAQGKSPDSEHDKLPRAHP